MNSVWTPYLLRFRSSLDHCVELEQNAQDQHQRAFIRPAVAWITKNLFGTLPGNHSTADHSGTTTAISRVVDALAVMLVLDGSDELKFKSQCSGVTTKLLGGRASLSALAKVAWNILQAKKDSDTRQDLMVDMASSWEYEGLNVGIPEPNDQPATGYSVEARSWLSAFSSLPSFSTQRDLHFGNASCAEQLNAFA